MTRRRIIRGRPRTRPRRYLPGGKGLSTRIKARKESNLYHTEQDAIMEWLRRKNLDFGAILYTWMEYQRALGQTGGPRSDTDFLFIITGPGYELEKALENTALGDSLDQFLLDTLGPESGWDIGFGYGGGSGSIVIFEFAPYRRAVGRRLRRR